MDIQIGQSVPWRHLSRRFRALVPESDDVRVAAATARALLLRSRGLERWVPKAAVSPDNARPTEAEARTMAEHDAARLIDDVSIPLKKAPEGAYEGVLSVPLRQYQKDVIATLEGHDRVDMGREQGTGKTPTSLARVLLYRDDLPLLVVCKKGLMAQWKSEMAKFAPSLLHRTTIINYDMIWRDSKRAWFEDFTSRPFHLILEEVGCLGNEEAKRTAKSMELASKATTVQMLSGSFFGGRFEKFYPCAVMQGFSGTREEFDRLFTIKTSIASMRRTRYGFERIHEERVVGYKNIDALVRATAERGAVFVRSSDCLDLPERNFETIEVPEPKEAKRHEAVIYAKRDPDEPVDAKAIDAACVKVRVCNSVANCKAKQEALRDLIEDAPVRWCLFYQYDAEREWLLSLAKRLGRPVSEVSGHKRDLDAYETRDDALVLLQIGAAAEGLNLQKANRMVFCSPYPADQTMQAEFRIWRMGQERPCFYYTLVTDGRFDKALLRRIEEGKANVGAIRQEADGESGS